MQQKVPQKDVERSGISRPFFMIEELSHLKGLISKDKLREEIRKELPKLFKCIKKCVENEETSVIVDEDE